MKRLRRFKVALLAVTAWGQGASAAIAQCPEKTSQVTRRAAPLKLSPIRFKEHQMGRLTDLGSGLRLSAIGVVAASTIITSSVSAQTEQASGKINQRQESGMSQATENEVKGKELQRAIDETYQRLVENKELKTEGNGKNIITSVVLKYVPLGTSFDDAEEILRAAGFTVGPRGEKDPNVFPSAYVSADIDQYVPTFFGKTSVSIYLEPINKSDWSRVHKLTAVIRKIHI